MVFNSPTLSYSLLAPILIILAGALVGVLIEAFVGKARRPIVQLSVALASLVLALIQVIRIRELSSTTVPWVQLLLMARAYCFKVRF
jgi:NADH-quinone oxidoreductase subunit N